VILPTDCIIAGLTDSKKLSPKQREKLYPLIRQQAVAFAVARASVDEIDRLNILHASMLAMKRAVTALALPPEFVYVDGNRCPDWQYPSQAVVKGDSKIAAIAAASILAKVERDQEMRELDSRFPGYGLAQHKGYPTKAHLAALQRLGPCEIHRKSFSPVLELLN
jgi:ribonuclease HII